MRKETANWPIACSQIGNDWSIQIRRSTKKITALSFLVGLWGLANNFGTSKFYFRLESEIEVVYFNALNLNFIFFRGPSYH